jgi:putative endonuclease
MLKKGYLYILASRRNGTLYVGVTSDLVKRIEEHRQKLVDGFTKKYEVTNLVYFETFEDIREAIIREKQIKGWTRKWKTELIQSNNPYWHDLYEDIQYGKVAGFRIKPGMTDKERMHYQLIAYSYAFGKNHFIRGENADSQTRGNRAPQAFAGGLHLRGCSISSLCSSEN